MRTALLALVAIVGLSLAGPAQAGGGTIEITWIKGGWFIGASAGSGVLHYGGRSYPLSIGGLSGGLIFGAAKADFHGEVYNINNPGDIAGVYGAGGAGVAAGPGGGVIALYNTNGVRLELRGRQVGLMFNADWSGLVIKLAP
jgi:hypothetical protein